MTRQEFINQVQATRNAFRRFLVALCCGNSQRADDIAQESYIKAYLSLDSLRDADSFRAWIYSIGYRVFLNTTRSERITLDYDHAAAVATGESADDAFRYQALYAALNSLTERERTAVVLFYLEGYAVKEIAALTDCKEDAVRQQLSRGRARLREIMGVPTEKKTIEKH